MPIPLTNLDDRAFADLVAETRALIPRYAAEWTDHNPSDPGITLIEMFAWLTEILIYRLNRIPEASEARFLELLGANFRPAKPAKVVFDLTGSNIGPAGLVLPSGTPIIALAPCRIAGIPYQTLHDVELSPGSLTAAVEAGQRSEIFGEVLGVSDGKPFQSFPLPQGRFIVFDQPTNADPSLAASSSALLPEPGAVSSQPTEINVTVGGETWSYQPNFLNSGGTDRHLTIDTRLNALLFGDGTRGRIPQSGDPVVVTYLSCLGRSGNPPNGASYAFDGLSPLLSAPLIDALQQGASINIGDPSLIEAGEDPISLATARTQAVDLLKTRWRAITTQDFAELVLEQIEFNLIRAKCLPEMDLTSPTPYEASPGNVSVIIVPDSISETPQPDQQTIERVWEFLDQRRLLTCRHHVVAPEYTPVRIRASVVRNPQVPEASIKDSLETNMRAFFHPLTGGPDNTGWPFGRDVHASEVYQVIEETVGVDHVETLTILTREPGGAWQDSGNHLSVPPNNLVHFLVDPNDLRVWTDR